MARVAVSHEGMKDPGAAVAPKREPVPEGTYMALITKTVMGSTNKAPILSKMSVEFQILHGFRSAEKDETHSGRRVYQDYILDPDPRYEDLSKTRRAELVQLLEATSAPFDAAGFDDDDILNKTVKIVVKHRKSREPDSDGNHRVFTQIDKIDSAEEVNQDDIV